MIGLCFVSGRTDGRRVVEAMLAEFAPQRQSLIEPFDGAAIGLARADGGFATDIVDGGRNGVSVLFVGEVFGEREPEAAPARALAQCFAENRLEDVAAWNGAFCALIADAANREIVLVTDRFGHRPVFVWEGDACVSGASRMPPLLADARVPRRLSRQGMVELASFQRTFGLHTQYADIRSMPAASLWRYGPQRRTHARTRKLAWRDADFTPREGAQRLADALTGAVARRSGGRVGLLLSGGLDARAMMAAARNNGGVIPCLTASSQENLETSLARRSAALAGMPIEVIDNRPKLLAERIDASVRLSDGLFSAPMNMFGLWPHVTGRYDAMQSGHGLDYTFRGYYLPCAMPRIAGSTTRLPMLRPVPDGSPATVAANLRVGIPRAHTRAALQDGEAGRLVARHEAAIAHALEACEPRSHYDAWDGFIMHTLGRHYAYSDFVAMDAYAVHRAPAYDHAVIDLYLAMPPQWRASGWMAQKAMTLLGPDLMRLPDAKTGFPAEWPFWAQLGAVFARAAGRRLGLVSRPPSAEVGATQGSWADYDIVFRTEQAFVERMTALKSAAALADSGLFDMARLSALIDDQLAGRLKAKRLFWQLLSLESWLRQFGYEGVADD
jgi:asparagine synthetase B (glutamine-hydrolysing)